MIAKIEKKEKLQVIWKGKTPLRGLPNSVSEYFSRYANFSFTARRN